MKSLGLVSWVMGTTPPGRKFRPTAHVGWHADSEGSRGVAECRKVAFSLRLLAEKLIPRFKNIVL